MYKIITFKTLEETQNYFQKLKSNNFKIANDFKLSNFIIIKNDKISYIFNGTCNLFYVSSCHKKDILEAVMELFNCYHLDDTSLNWFNDVLIDLPKNDYQRALSFINLYNKMIKLENTENLNAEEKKQLIRLQIRYEKNCILKYETENSDALQLAKNLYVFINYKRNVIKFRKSLRG